MIIFLMNQCIPHTQLMQHGDIRIHMLVRDYKGPGDYVLDGVSIEAPGKHFEKARGASGTLSVQNDTDGWVSGTFNFRVQTAGGEILAFSDGLFRVTDQNRLPGTFLK